MWGSIYFDSASTSNILRYCKVNYSYGIDRLRKDVSSTGAIVLYYSDLLLENCIVAKNWRGIETSNSSLVINNSSLIDNEEVGIMISDKNNITLTNSIVWGSFYTIYLYADQKSVNKYLKISYSILEKNVYKIKGLNIYDKKPEFIDSEKYEIVNGSFYSNKGSNGGMIGLR